MIKKILLGLVLTLSIFSLAILPSFAQAERELTADPDTQLENLDPQIYQNQLYEALDDANTNLDDTYNYEDLTAEEQAAVQGLAALFGGAMLVFVGIGAVIGLASYIFMSLALVKIANYMNIKDAWYAWVPILNFVLLCRMAEISAWSVLLIIVPGVNAIYMLVLMALAFMKASEKRGLDKLMGLLVLVPIVQYFFMGYLAWGKFDKKVEA